MPRWWPRRTSTASRWCSPACSSFGINPTRTRMNKSFETLEHRPPYVMAACVTLGALLLYVLTLAPTTQFWDASEYIAAAYTLGIPHPPGNPLFVVVAHVWGLIPWVESYAQRINLFAAVTNAGS